MTRKDYIMLALALADAAERCNNDDEADGVDLAGETIADRLAADNHRFDRARFLKTAGIGEPVPQQREMLDVPAFLRRQAD